MLLDTSVWVEYLKGSKIGETVQSVIKESQIYTCPLTIAEISGWCYKNNEEPFPYLNEITALSKITELNEEILTRSGKIYYEERTAGNQKISMIDCIIYATASFHNLILLTKDSDFEGLKGVRLLK